MTKPAPEGFNSIIFVFGLQNIILAKPPPCSPIISSAFLKICIWFSKEI